MADTQTAGPLGDAPGADVPDEFDQLIADVRRMADGIAGIRELLESVITEDDRHRMRVRVTE